MKGANAGRFCGAAGPLSSCCAFAAGGQGAAGSAPECPTFRTPLAGISQRGPSLVLFGPEGSHGKLARGRWLAQWQFNCTILSAYSGSGAWASLGRKRDRTAGVPQWR